MPQPPTTPIIRKENVRLIPALTQRTFQSAAAGAGATFVWEWDLALRITDFNQFIGTVIFAPANSATTAAGVAGAGPQTVPQPALGPFLDAAVFCNGVGGATITVEFAIDSSPCNYRTVAITIVPQNVFTNIAQLRVTGRFARVTATNVTAAATIEFGSYIRNL
jgi:hypothetical protein